VSRGGMIAEGRAWAREKERPGQLATEMGNGKSSTLATLAGTYPGRSSSWGRKLLANLGEVG
jgi:hypothetical protein